MRGVEFVVDEDGKKKAVLIDLKKHGTVWEDFYDVLRAKEREEEPRESLQEVKTFKAYYWSDVFHKEAVVDGAEFKQFKKDYLKIADKRSREIKPERKANEEQYLYALYKAIKRYPDEKSKILDWFFEDRLTQEKPDASL